MGFWQAVTIGVWQNQIQAAQPNERCARYRSIKEQSNVDQAQQTESAHGNHPHSSICDHRGGTIAHETWCITCNAIVRYAYGIVFAT